MTTRTATVFVALAVLFPGNAGTAVEFGRVRHPQEQNLPRYAPPVRGVAEIGHLAPKTSVDGDAVVTIIQVKNLEGSPVAGLKAEEFWWDRSGNLAGSAVMRLKTPLASLEVATFTLRTPRNPRMFQNTIRFSHSFGPVKAVRLRVLD